MKITLKDVHDREPCEDGKLFLWRFESAKAAWEECNNPDWLLWGLHKFPGVLTRKAAVDIAKRVNARATLPDYIFNPATGTDAKVFLSWAMFRAQSIAQQNNKDAFIGLINERAAQCRDIREVLAKRINRILE